MTPDLQEVMKGLKSIIDSFFGSPLLLIILLLPIILWLAFQMGSFFINLIEGAMVAPDEKPKRQPLSFFEGPTETDEVVGFGDDGELLYASEKPKRKNDEVDE